MSRVLAEVEQPPINPLVADAKRSQCCADLPYRKEAIAVYQAFLKAASRDAEDRRREFVARILLSLILLLQKQEPFYAGQEVQRTLDGELSPWKVNSADVEDSHSRNGKFPLGIGAGGCSSYCEHAVSQAHNID